MKRVKWLISFITLITFSISLMAENTAVVRYIEGKAYVQGASSEERELLTINSPIFEGDNIWLTEGNMGIVFSEGTIIWLSSDSHIEISQFPYPYSESPLGLKANLWRGMAVLEAKFPIPTESSHIIITPSASVRTARKSLSIIEVENVDMTRLTVLDGSAIIASGGYSNTVWANQMSYAQYGYEPSAPVSTGKVAYPEIIAFREKMTNKPIRTPKSWEYLDPELYAFAIDLDYYGYWEDVPGYGHVWFPSPAYVYYGWTPYYNGYWRYTPWGCTWVSYDPWGWVPFHYGHWTYIIGYGWGWFPDVWFSPAWVAWFWGDGWIGWCPWGYYNGWWCPIWEPCGWYRIDIDNIYVTNVTKVVVVNKNVPPPVKPVVPIPKKAFQTNQNFAKKVSKDSDLVITHSGGLNISPTKIHDFKNKKVTFDDIKQTLIEQPVIAKRNIMPTSLDGDIDNPRDKIHIRDRNLTSPTSPKRVTDNSVIDKPARTSPSTRIRTPIDNADDFYSDTDTPEPSRGDFSNSDSSFSPPSTREPQNGETPQRDDSINRDSHSRDNNYSPPPPPPSPPPTREPQNREIPQRETPKRETPQRDNSINRDSHSRDNNYSPPPPPPSPPAGSSGSSFNKTNKHKLSMAKPSKSKITILASNSGKTSKVTTTYSKTSYSGKKNNSGSSEKKNKRI